MKIDPTEVQKLLRQRRDVAPPHEDYFEDFLLDFQRRQRNEMLRRPTWEILRDRASAWLDGFRVPSMAYASIVAVAVGATTLLISGQDESSNAPKFVTQSFTTPAPLSVPVAAVSTGADLPPSYVLESRPVSNDRPFSF